MILYQVFLFFQFLYKILCYILFLICQIKLNQTNSLSLSEKDLKKLFKDSKITEEEFENQTAPGSDYSEAFLKGMGLKSVEEKKTMEIEESSDDAEEYSNKRMISQEEIDALFIDEKNSENE